jgi:hypothetical protein
MRWSLSGRQTAIPAESHAIRIMALACIGIGLSGCDTIFNPYGAPSLRDARLERLETVRESVVSRNGFRIPPPLIMVIFSTDRDLTSYNRTYGASFNLNAGLCQSDDQPDPLRFVAHGEVTTPTGEPVDSFLPPPADSSARQDGRYPYRFYLYARSTAHSFSAERALVDHDLMRDNDDICFAFSGGSVLALPHRSSGFRIPYALIAEALARARMPYALVTPGS